MATRNFVPRANNEGSLGTSIKHWLKGWFGDLFVSGNITDGNESITVAQIVAGSTIPGPSGSIGPQGPSGSIGPDGAEGSIGPSGSIGLTGPEGPSGSVGPEGPEGPTGPSGSIGPDGAEGPEGPEGPSGSVGPEGPIGPSGSTSSVYAETSSYASSFKIGKFLYSQSFGTAVEGTSSVASVSKTDYSGMIIDYVITSGSLGQMLGTLTATWNADSHSFFDTTTVFVGDNTEDVITVSSSFDAALVYMDVMSTAGSWDVKASIRAV